MIKSQTAIDKARSLLGTPYSRIDCINLIKRVIRDCPGGNPHYTTAGTNTLWDSYNSSGKYRDLTWRQESLDGAKPGMLAFKRYNGTDEGHVGIVTERGTVVHSSSAKGEVVETPLTAREGWDLLAIHKYIEAGETAEGEDENVLYRAEVITQSGDLRVRQEPETGAIIGHVPKGATVDVLKDGSWPRIRYGEVVGYVSGEYLRKIEEAGAPVIVPGDFTIIDSVGNTFKPVGGWRVIVGSVD